MAPATGPTTNASLPPGKPPQYVVVARRYRPQAFDELVGQEHIARALSNAIQTHRVGHAYLFTGARGVGKTSTARILAKALNCQHGPTVTPCNECDICRSIGSGEDVDVLEIDGASNRGIDEIRQLRQNAGVRPSRSRFKIYIIDEVHMLTREAFNALLKTLEEPPEHVKFIFCTTEASKIPVTILSRCQRFDFAGILTPSISQRLRQIVDAEGVQAEPEALTILARRASGSMRDAQSLLEQLLAFSPQKITVADVHGMLGTAGEERLTRILGHIVNRQPSGALAELDAAVDEGVDVGQLIEQLFGFLRDAMAAAVGCPAESFLHVSPAGRQQVISAGGELGLETILAAMQILDQTLSRLRYSTQGRILAELALVRICQLEDLEELPTLIAQLQGRASAGAVQPPLPARAVRPALPAGSVSPGGDAGLAAGSAGASAGANGPAASQTDGPAAAVSSPSATPAAKKKADVDGSSPPDAEAPQRPTEAPRQRTVLSGDNAASVWDEVVAKLGSISADSARNYSRIAISAPNTLVVYLKPGYTFAKTICERPDQLAQFERALAELTGQAMSVQFAVEEAPVAQEPVAAVRAVSPHQRLMEVAEHPMVRRASELFGAQPVRVDEGPVTAKER
jgi:DNA polymerase-3 subunit gamma/tau